MSTDDQLALLASLDRKSAAVRRRAALGAWASVILAAIVMCALIFAGHKQLADIQAEIHAKESELDFKQSQLKAANGRLEETQGKLTKVVENYGKLTANYTGSFSNSNSGSGSAPPPSPDTSVPSTGTPPLVYPQIVKEDDRMRAETILSKLRAAGYPSQRIDAVKKARPLRNTEVRYYKNTDAAEANKIVDALNKAGDESAIPIYLKLDNNPQLHARTFEIWFGSQTGPQ